MLANVLNRFSATTPGGAKGGCFYSKRFSANSGLNSANLDFLPVQNIEESDVIVGVGAVPVGESICATFFIPPTFLYSLSN